VSDDHITENGSVAATDEQATTEVLPVAQSAVAEPGVPAPGGAAASVSQPPARTNRTGTYAFAVAAAVVLALGVSAVSFGAGVFVGRTSNRFAPSQQAAVPGMGAPGMRGQQMPPGAWGDGRGMSEDGEMRRGPRGHDGYGRRWQQQTPDGGTQFVPDTGTQQAPTDQ